MLNFNFIAGNKFELDDFKDIEKFVDAFPDFQTVVLSNEGELNLLLQLFGIENARPHPLDKSIFSKYWDISNAKLPEYNSAQFSQFYHKWLEISGRENHLDEYGNLIFLQGRSRVWNQYDFRLIVKDEEENR